MSDEEVKTQWGIVELMGHKTVAGQISKSEMLGKPLLRVDVPATAAFPAFTQFYGETAIYCVTFTSEEVSRLTAERCNVNPVSVYTPDLISKERYVADMAEMQKVIDRLRNEKRLPGGNDSGDEDLREEDHNLDGVDDPNSSNYVPF